MRRGRKQGIAWPGVLRRCDSRTLSVRGDMLGRRRGLGSTAGLLRGAAALEALSTPLMLHPHGEREVLLSRPLNHALVVEPSLRGAGREPSPERVEAAGVTHPKINRVFYLGLPSHPQHELAKSQMRGFGGVVTFEVKGGLREVKRVVNRLKLIMHATSLGGVESTVHIPVLTSHIQFSNKELKAADVSEGMIRLSCGIEDAEDLIADLRRALK